MQWAGQGCVNCKDVCNNCAIYQINTPGTTQAYEGRGARGLLSVARSCEEPNRSQKKHEREERRENNAMRSSKWK